MERPEDKEQDSTMPAPEEEARFEEAPAGEPQAEPTAGADEPADAGMSAEAESPTDATAGAEEPLEPEEATEEPVAEVSPELVAAVNEAFAGADAAAEGETAEGEGAEEEEDILLDWQPGQWFVVHTYAGYENKVKTNLESRILSMNMEEKIHEVVIPTEDVMEVKSGKKQVVQKKVFPGYLLVRMDLDDDSWYVVRNTPGVTGFVGSGTKPIPLSDKEVDRVLQRKVTEERPKPRLEFTAGDGVRVVTGPFANFQGVISDIDADRSKLKVLVNIFGRETPVELGFDQVAKI